MPFWNSETLKERIPKDEIISPYNPDQIVRGAYELLMGSEAFITSTDSKKKVQLADGEPVVIPPGQFGLLLTEESVKIPLNIIAFISMKFRVKSRGLINVSGFHVDPGFEGRLKFSVYNAGSTNITITRGERVFPIWFCHLTGDEEKSGGEHWGQDAITSDDQNRMHGEVASPGQLKKDIVDLEQNLRNDSAKLEQDLKKDFSKLEQSHGNFKWILTVVSVLLLVTLIRSWITLAVAPSSDTIKELKRELKMELKQELDKELQPSAEKAGTSNTKQQTSAPGTDTATKPGKDQSPANAGAQR